MKSFFKYLLATVVGMLLVSLIMFFVMIGSLGSLLSKGSVSSVSVKENSVLQIDLNKTVNDQARTSGLSGISPLNPKFDMSKSLGLNEMLRVIKAAKNDDKIKGIYLNCENSGLGLATTQELRKALSDFKESGKYIYSYADGYSSSEYHLVSLADSVFLQPQGMLTFQGLGARLMFFTRFLQKVGVEMQVIRHGQFKSAVEPFFRTDMSPANRHQYEVMFGSMWPVILADVSASRGLSEARLNEIADSLLGFTATSALRAGLVDALVPRSYIKEKILPARMGVADSLWEKELNIVSYGDYLANLNAAKSKKAKDKIAVVYAEGEIVGGEGSGNGIGTDLAAQIQKAVKDKNVKALVLRVNSPGGSVLTADIIYQELMKVKAKMPVVASYGNYAASGGYYISCMADRIFAQPNTLTGSIGVFGTIPNAQELLTKKLGFDFDEVKTNKNATAFKSMSRPMNAYEKAMMQQNIEEIYEGFVSKVAAGRGMTWAQVDSIGQGRVWSGTSALQIGLVDTLGGLEDALACAASLAGLENYTVVEYPKEKDFMAQLMEMFSAKASAKMQLRMTEEMGAEWSEAYRLLMQLRDANEPQVWARMEDVVVFE